MELSTREKANTAAVRVDEDAVVFEGRAQFLCPTRISTLSFASRPIPVKSGELDCVDSSRVRGEYTSETSTVPAGVRATTGEPETATSDPASVKGLLL